MNRGYKQGILWDKDLFLKGKIKTIRETPDGQSIKIYIRGKNKIPEAYQKVQKVVNKYQIW
ncbi:MAG: hypothetical protein N2169_00495 [bacterium]|nr:hypothetical protein [bacterium]